MKSELRNLNEETRDLPFPKLMISDIGTIILATCVNDGRVTGTVVGECKYMHGMGHYSEIWQECSFKDLPEGAEIVLSNNKTD